MCFAYDGIELVGFGRTVDDGKYYALIVDLIVSPKYQGKGIGGKILHELKDALEDYYFITLTSDVNKEGFYLKQGWKKTKNSIYLATIRKAKILSCKRAIDNRNPRGYNMMYDQIIQT